MSQPSQQSRILPLRYGRVSTAHKSEGIVYRAAYGRYYYYTVDYGFIIWRPKPQYTESGTSAIWADRITPLNTWKIAINKKLNSELQQAFIDSGMHLDEFARRKDIVKALQTLEANI